MDLNSCYNAIKQRINCVNFEVLWKGFKPYKFALYNDTQCYYDGTYIDKTDVFIGNTAIRFDNEHIAIWCLMEEPKDLDRLAASIIHEMFHAYQGDFGECRWADEMQALFSYKYSPLNLSLKIEEAKLIKQIVANQDKSLFGKLLELRKHRCTLFPFEYQYEGKIEQIEGSANYVEMNALSQINNEKYTSMITSAVDLINEPKFYFPIRIVCYKIGALLLECIRKCSTFDYCTFGDKPFAEEILANAKDTQIDVAINDADNLIKKYHDETQAIINNALDKNKIIVQGSYDLVSVNIWDARCKGRYVTSRRFVAFNNCKDTQVVNGDFVVEFDADKKIHAIYEQ